ncbi:tRNA (adenosine(37)-N6)-threonylcarbamoyltransferase complex dimerization subunit type 1 TsaB [bacterium]|nr:tRNA (adenosine(37)-N6)-threonylcarbamoyltransferase complex dimerization subunit type 1 TsaB [bacterium]
MPASSPLLLAIETATSVCSVALVQDGSVLSEVKGNGLRRHNEALPGLVGELLETQDKTGSDVGVIAVSIGPGSFTGLRIGLSFAKGFALGVEADIVPVGTLDGMALSMLDRTEVTALGSDLKLCPLTFARRGEVFGRLFRLSKTGLTPLSDPFLSDADQLLKYTADGYIIGGEGADALFESANDGVSAAEEKLFSDESGIIYLPGLIASAQYIGSLGFEIWQEKKGSLQPHRSLEPLYLKEFTVKEKSTDCFATLAKTVKNR